MGFVNEISGEVSQEKKHIDYVAEVVTARLVTGEKVKKPFVSFNMKLNGVSIYGCTLREYTKDGKEGYVVGFPSRIGSNGKYYTHAWAPISKDLTTSIAKQCEKIIKDEMSQTHCEDEQGTEVGDVLPFADEQED